MADYPKEQYTIWMREWRRKNPDRQKELEKQQRDYLRQNYICVVINGKRTLIKTPKRLRPDDICELCKKKCKILHYHHWDDSNTICGIWICVQCHVSISGLERGLNGIWDKYLLIKDCLNKKYPTPN